MSPRAASDVSPPAQPDAAAPIAEREPEAPDAAAPLQRCVAPRLAMKHASKQRDSTPAWAEDDGESAYFRFFDAVAQRFERADVAALDACCKRAGKDALAAEYCSAGRSLLLHAQDDAALVRTMPIAKRRLAASNELDIVLSSYEAAGAEPFGLYFSKLWRLAHDGNVGALAGFMAMFEQSHGVHAEGAESALCALRNERPELFAPELLQREHPAAMAELSAHCPRVP